MPTLILIFVVAAGVLLLVAVLPQLEVRLPRRYRDIIYMRLRRDGGRIDVWRGKPVRNIREIEFNWTPQERRDFDRDGMPKSANSAVTHIRTRLKPVWRRFPFQPIIVLHTIDKAMGGLSPQDRQLLNRIGAELGEQVLIGDLPNAFPERAFHELRENGMGPWGQN